MRTIQLTFLLASLLLTLTASTVIIVERMPKIVELGQGKYAIVINEDQTSHQVISQLQLLNAKRKFIPGVFPSKDNYPKDNYLPSVLPPENINFIPSVLPPNNTNYLPSVLPPNNTNYLPSVLPPNNNKYLPSVLPPNNSHSTGAIKPKEHGKGYIKDKHESDYSADSAKQNDRAKMYAQFSKNHQNSDQSENPVVYAKAPSATTTQTAEQDIPILTTTQPKLNMVNPFANSQSSNLNMVNPFANTQALNTKQIHHPSRNIFKTTSIQTSKSSSSSSIGASQISQASNNLNKQPNVIKTISQTTP